MKQPASAAASSSSGLVAGRPSSHAGLERVGALEGAAAQGQATAAGLHVALPTRLRPTSDPEPHKPLLQRFVVSIKPFRPISCATTIPCSHTRMTSRRCARGSPRSRAGSRSWTRPAARRSPTRSATRSPARMREASANMGAGYATSHRAAAIVDEAEARPPASSAASPRDDLRRQHDLAELHALAHRRARVRRRRRDLVSALDHDGGVAPWLELAHDKDLVVKHIEVGDDMSSRRDLASMLAERTRVVAFAWASNAIGTITTPRGSCELAHGAGALAWVDAVHYAAHEPIDVRAIDADILICSPYKFYGPHLGMAFGRADLLETWRPYKVRPAPDDPPDAGSRPARSPRAAGRLTRRSTTSTRSAASTRSSRMRIARRAFPEHDLRRGDRLRAAGHGGPRADVPDQRRGRAGGRRGRAPRRARYRRVGPRLVVLARAVPASSATRRTPSGSGSSTTTRSRRSTGGGGPRVGAGLRGSRRGSRGGGALGASSPGRWVAGGHHWR